MRPTSLTLMTLLFLAGGCTEAEPQETAPAPRPAPVESEPDPLFVAYGEILEAHVDLATGMVSYSKLREDAARMESLDAFARSLLRKDATADQRMAGMINRYNARVLHLVAREFPSLSQADNGVLSQVDFFKRAVPLEGRQISLNDYESEIRKLAFPAIHFIVNCGSKGCPRLAAEPFEGESIRTEADRLEKSALLATSRVQKERGKQVVEVIELLYWYGKDFTGIDPKAEPARHSDGLRKYILDHLPAAGKSLLRQALMAGAEIRSRTDWDWSVNGS